MPTISETAPQNPLAVINCFNEGRARYSQYKGRFYGTAYLGLAGSFTSAVTGAPVEITVAVAASSLATALVFTGKSLRAGRSSRDITQFQLETAYAQLFTEGDKLPDNCSLEQMAQYGLAQQIRATKLFLAEQGKLDRYQEFKWLHPTCIPEHLRPTEDELNEVNRWEQDRNAQLASFTSDLLKGDCVLIECGPGQVFDKSQVYLFPNQNDVWDYQAQPLLDVMRALAANEKELQTIDVNNTLAYFRDPNRYEGVYSSVGRQRLADFFGRPTYFYQGAEQVPIRRKIYGVWEEDFQTVNSLPEFLYRRSLGQGGEPFSGIEVVEPTSTRLAHLGMELAKN